MSDYTEEEFLALAKNAIRRVQTLEGAKFYGLPIGAIITADVIKSKNSQAAAKGVKAPEGAISSGGSSIPGGSSPQTPTTAKITTAKTAEGLDEAVDDASAGPTGPDVFPSTINGPLVFKVGETQYSAPAGSKLFRSKNNEDVAYVLTKTGNVHAFSPSGEVGVPDYLVPVLAAKFTKMKGEDSLYKEEVFNFKAPKNLANEKVGAILNKNGKPAFKKVDEGLWVSETIGVQLTDDDLQTPFEDGLFDLQPATVTEADFSKMSLDELQTALESYPEGKQLGMQGGATLTKDENGLWVSSITGAGTDSETLATIAEGTSFLADSPLPEPSSGAAKKSKKSKKDDEVEDPLLDSERELNDANAQKKLAQANLATGADVKAMPVESVLYHDSLGEIKKIEENTWEINGSLYAQEDVMSSAGYGHISKLPWEPASSEEEAESEPEAPEAPETPEPESSTEETAAPKSDRHKLSSVSELSELKPGDKIYLQDPFGEDDDVIPITVAGEGKFTTPGGYTFIPEDFEHDIDQGYVSIDKKPAQSVEDKPAEEKAPDQWEQLLMENPAPQADSVKVGGNEIAVSDVDAAIESLEAHSGFQISYGLKSLDSAHPLKDKAVLDAVVAEAKEKYPAKSPKAALVEHLKVSVGKGEEPLADWEKELLSDGLINIGADSPKNTATGVTGGKFSQEDIQEAIDILENFQGKAFKSELNKKGNPLGTLSPNDIVGFNKDKTITKNNFLALLKTKLAKSDTSEPETPEDVIEDDENLDDLTDFGDEENFGDYEDDNPPLLSEVNPADMSLETFASLPYGTQIEFQKNPGTQTFTYTKASRNKWVYTAPDGSVFPFSDTTMTTGIMNEEGWKFLDYEAPKSDSSAIEPEAVDSPPVEDNNKPKMENGHILIDSGFAHKIGGQAGSNAGGLYNLTTENGVEKFYVKKAQTKEHGDNETLANALYKRLGVNAPEVDHASDGNLYSKIVDGKQDMADRLNDPEWLDKVQKDFAIDAWLSNRDVFGLTYDNILTDSDGTPWRIDNGGALLYRAMGAKKVDFGDEVTELHIFRKGKKSQVFGPDVMSKENELDGAKRLSKLSPDEIRDMVSEADLPDSLADTLIARRKYVLDFYELADPYADAEETDVSEAVDVPETVDAPEVTNDVHDIAPGKYNTGKGAKAHLWVKPDGTGVYQGMKGVLKPLDAEGVKKNYDLGMSNLVDTPSLESYPDVDPDGIVADAKSIPTLGSVDSLPDGTYLGPFNTTYVVKGDEVTASKAAKSSPLTDLTVGKSPTAQFLDDAPVGTKLAFRWNTKDDPDYTAEKLEDGTWKTDGQGYFDYIKSGYAYYQKRWKIVSFPASDPTPVKKSSLKSKYLQGKLQDPSTGTSVIPPGYSGELYFHEAATSVSSIAQWKDYLADPDVSLVEKKFSHTKFGVPVNVPAYSSFLQAKNGKVDGWDSNEEFLDAIVSDVNEYLAKADIPKLKKVTDFAPKDSNGYFVKPEALKADTPGYYTSAADWTAYVKGVSSGFGGAVGQLPTSMTKDEKMSWAGYLKDGNFAQAYDIEVSAAAKKGKTLPNPSKHPGHPINSETGHIKWAAAVDGELPAGHTIPGQWSSKNVNASVAELDNYLILAKMQNPTQLDIAQKRQWVNAHRLGHGTVVDGLSIAAKQRAQNGFEPKSLEPVWTDDVKPAKSYDHLFDDTNYPQNWSEYYNSDAATEFYAENAEHEPKLKQLYESEVQKSPYNYDWQNKGNAINEFFREQEEAYLEELNKPVYKVVRTINTGSHATFIVQDQFDRKKIFKPLTPGKEWRAENEAYAHNLGASLGFSVPKAAIYEVNEGLPMGTNNKGVVMDFAPNVGSFGNVEGAAVKIEDLTQKQLGQLASEHVLDWFLDNDDTHNENILIGESGEIVAIDKGRAFLQYGHWFGLDVDNPEALNVNTKDSAGNNVVYHDMVTAIKSGKISQEKMDAAYAAATKAAKRIQKFSAAKVEQAVRDATANRTSWETPDYAKDWPTLFDSPQSQDELVAAVLARKASISEDFEEMWTKLYASSGMTKPEAPKKLVGENIASGWEESDLMENVVKSKAWGTSTLHASPGIKGGASLIWEEETYSGEKQIVGKLSLGEITQQKVLSFLSTKVDSKNSQVSSGAVKNFPTSHVKSFKKHITAAAKNVSSNATTGDYDTYLWAEMKASEERMDADLAHVPSVDMSSEEWVEFPSGVSMPAETVPQYVLALQHNKKMILKLEQAKDNKVATSKEDFKDFSPQSWKVEGKNYVNENGEKYKQLENGDWLYIAEGSVMAVTAPLPLKVTSGSDGWTLEGEKDTPDLEPHKYSYSSASQEAGELLPGGVKKLSGSKSSEGHQGSQYRVDLSTGETIFFRNSSATHTAKTQQGSVQFVLNNSLSSEASLANVQNYLDTWGLSVEGADELSAETIYWRQMFDRLILSNGNGASQEAKAARNQLQHMRTELASKVGHPVGDADIVEAIGLTESDEHGFWDALAKSTWGADKVNAWIAEDRHLPQYSHMSLDDTSIPTGMPYFNRIDVDMDEIYGHGTMIAIGNKSGDSRNFDYIKAGGMASTEERLRLLGVFINGQSSQADQGSGGANGVFTRIATGDAKVSGSLVGKHRVYWSPAVLAQTGTYSYSSDSYGNTDYLTNNNPTNPVYALENFGGSDNETLVPNTLSIFDFMEIMVFDDENQRLKAIEEFKKLGIEELRGLPIEDRLINRVNLQSALKKAKEAWKS